MEKNNLDDVCASLSHKSLKCSYVSFCVVGALGLGLAILIMFRPLLPSPSLLQLLVTLFSFMHAKNIGVYHILSYSIVGQ
jgi:uncharacterized membrane protein YbaN (DUF454 family)